MKKWMLVACVALLGLAQASDRIVDGDQDQEVGRVTPPTTSTTPMVGPADTTEKEEWPPLDVRYLEPVGFHWPDNPEEEKGGNKAARIIFRILAISCLMSEGKSPEDAVNEYCSFAPEQRSFYGFSYLLRENNPEAEKAFDICNSTGPNSEEKLRAYVTALYADAPNHPD